MAARTQIRTNHAGIAAAAVEADEVLVLGEQLFHDPRGPLATFPHDHGAEPEIKQRKPSAPTARGKIAPVELLSPRRVVLRLHATAGGCQWLLDRWSELRDILDNAWSWHPSDKLKAVRLLSRQPLDAVDDRDVLMIFAACQAMDGRPGTEIPEIVNELPPHEHAYFHQRLKERGLDLITPLNARFARETLIEMIDDVTKRIRADLEQHQARAAANAALNADAFGFDDSAEGERLRRYELACGLAIKRSLEMVFKLRREAARSRPGGAVETAVGDDDRPSVSHATDEASKTTNNDERDTPASTHRVANAPVARTSAAAIANVSSRDDRSGPHTRPAKHVENAARRDIADHADGTVARRRRAGKMSDETKQCGLKETVEPKNVHPPQPDPRMAGRPAVANQPMPELTGTGAPRISGDLSLVEVFGLMPASEPPCWASG